MKILKCGRFVLEMDRPRVMAIVNVTPDSFSGDGVGRSIDAGLRRAEVALEAGADFLDLGGESSRPGAEPVSEQEELDRVIPLVERLADCSVPISVDTVKPVVMRAALAAGASMINDINAFREPGAVEAVAGSGAALCVMHMQGTPQTMQIDPRYENVVDDVLGFLDDRVVDLCAHGISRECIVLDPGFGFGKTVDHNLALFRGLSRFVETGLPVLVGLSRKSILGAITGRPAAERVTASVAAALLAVQRGARIVRVHDVVPTRDALAVWEVVERGQARV